MSPRCHDPVSITRVALTLACGALSAEIACAARNRTRFAVLPQSVVGGRWSRHSRHNRITINVSAAAPARLREEPTSVVLQ